jgi:hypothetical protein
VSIDWARSTHPDLIDEEQAARTVATEPAPDPQRRRRSRPASPPSGTSDDASTTPPVLSDVAEAGDSEASLPSESSAAAPESAPEPEVPEWFAQVRDAKDPRAALQALAKNLPYEQLEQDEVLSGVLGRLSDRRAQQLLRQQQQQRQEQAKRQAAEKGDLYALGELSAPEILERARSEAAASASAPFMDGITAFQQTLDESIQRKVAGQTFGAGKGHAEGVKEYVSFIVEEATKLGIERELKRRESALRKSVLSEVNGDEPVPERDSGTPSRVREVTDEQIAAMSQAEYESLFEPGGRPKPGVRHRSTRGVPLQRH